MRSRLAPALCLLAIAVVPCRGQTETTALWLFDEPAGCYPSTTLTDNGPDDITVVLGRGAVLAPGRFGNSLAVRPPQSLRTRGGDQILFGLGQAPTPPGRIVAPMSWESANFAAFQTRGERHLRHMEFANASATRLNLGDFDWTVECWAAFDRGAVGEGTLFEIGEGPRGENDRVTRLGVDPAGGRWLFFNGPSQVTASMPSSRAGWEDGAWRHVAFVHAAAAGVLTHYLDGRRMSQAAAANVQALAEGEEAYFSIGRDGRWERPFPGRIDELRFSVGQAYREEFAPPASFSRVGRNPRQPAALKAGPPLLFPPGEPPAEVLALGTRKHVFWDDALVAQATNVEFAVQPPSSSVRVHDDVSGHTSIVEDEEGLLRLYYRGPRDCLAVLTSRDGVTWQAPDLGCEYAGARNVVVRDAGACGNVFLDPNAPPEERWKYVSGRNHETIFLYWSADGWDFTRGETAVIPLAAGSQSTVFYDDQRQLYVGHHRSDYGSDAEGHTRRMFLRTELQDLMTPWPFTPVTPEDTARIARTLPIKNDQIDPWYLDNGPLAPSGIGVEYPVAFQPDPAADLPGVDMYVPKALKYPWAPDAYVAFPTLFFHYDFGPETRKILGGEGRRQRGDGPTECQLAVSRDGLAWRRMPRPAYIGIGRHDGKDLKMIYSTYNLVRRGDEIWHYFLGLENYHGSNALPKTRWDLYRVTQRLDGFVAAEAPIGGGRLVTKPLTFAGNRLRLNIDTDAVGYAQVGFLDERGESVPGYAVEDCVYVNGDAVEYEAEWLDKGADVSSLAGKTVRMVLELHGAKLYALQFADVAN
jgi:hypothetical protein